MQGLNIQKDGQLICTQHIRESDANHRSSLVFK